MACLLFLTAAVPRNGRCLYDLSLTKGVLYSSLAQCSVVLFEALCQLLDILRRPARHLHAEMEAHLRQHFLDLVERLAAEIRRPQHLAFALLDQVTDINDVV